MAAADITTAVVAVITEATTSVAYERDSDRKTRGAGAIAAFDQASRNAPVRARRRRQQARATKVHDARMVAVERGALAALGRVNLTSPTFRGGERLITGGTMVQSGMFVPKTPVVGLKPPTVMTQSPVAKLPPMSAYTGGNDLAIGPVDIPPPPPVPPPIAVVTPKPPTPSGSGGSAPGVTPTGGPGAMTTFDAPVAVPDVPASSGTSMKTVLVVGGAALAAYLLFRRSSP